MSASAIGNLAETLGPAELVFAEEAASPLVDRFASFLATRIHVDFEARPDAHVGQPAPLAELSGLAREMARALLVDLPPAGRSIFLARLAVSVLPDLVLGLGYEDVRFEVDAEDEKVPADLVDPPSLLPSQASDGSCRRCVLIAEKALSGRLAQYLSAGTWYSGLRVLASLIGEHEPRSAEEWADQLERSWESALDQAAD